METPGDQHLNIPTVSTRKDSPTLSRIVSALTRRLSIRSTISRDSIVRPRQPDTFSTYADPEVPFSFKVPNIVINDGLGSSPVSPSRFTIGSPEPRNFSMHSSRQSSIVSFVVPNESNVPEIQIDKSTRPNSRFTMIETADEKKDKSSCGTWTLRVICCLW